MDEQTLDCLIIGGGPAGLTAAIYLARFHLDILLVDAGKSRASWIPCTRNVPGFPDGIGGTELLQRMRDQTCKYGAKVESEFVTKLERDETTGLFAATWGSGCRIARSVLLATGVTNRRPPRRACGAARDEPPPPPPADGRGAARRSTRPRPDPLLSHLRRL